MCTQKLTDASLIYRTVPKTKNSKMKKLKSKTIRRALVPDNKGISVLPYTTFGTVIWCTCVLSKMNPLAFVYNFFTVTPTVTTDNAKVKR